MRCPTSRDWRSELFHIGFIVGITDRVRSSALIANYGGTRTNVYNMFQSVHGWFDFSNTIPDPGSGKVVANSLESIHNNIHV